MNIKGFLKITVLFSAAFLFLSAEVQAEDTYDFGQSGIYEALPDEAEEMLGQLDITAENGGSELSAENLLETVWNVLAGSISKPVTMLASIAAVIILCSVIEAMNDGSSTLTGTFGTVGILACSGIICVSFSAVLESAKTAIEGFSSFLAVFIPTLAGIMAASGQTSSAALYNGTVVMATQLFSQIVSAVIFPLTSCIMGISVAGSIDPDIKINNIAETVKKLINWGLGLLATIFTGLVSIQGFVSASADSVAMKAVKFTFSGSVPIVGGAVSDALSTVKSSMELIKSTTGSFGILALSIYALPLLVSLLLFRAAMLVSASLSDVFGTSRLTPLLKSGENAVAIIIAAVMFYLLVAVVSTALILAISGGAS